MENLDAQTRGMAMASELIVFSLIGHLKAKGVLSKDETVAIYEETLTVLESYPQHDPSIYEARKILDQMATIAATGPKPSPKRGG